MKKGAVMLKVKNDIWCPVKVYVNNCYTSTIQVCGTAISCKQVVESIKRKGFTFSNHKVIPVKGCTVTAKFKY